VWSSVMEHRLVLLEGTSVLEENMASMFIATFPHQDTGGKATVF